MKNVFRINSKIWVFIAVPVLSFAFALSGYAANIVYAFTPTIESNASYGSKGFEEAIGGGNIIYGRIIPHILMTFLLKYNLKDG